MSIDTPYPLTAWMQGTATIHFKTGHTLQRRMSRETADRFRLMVEHKQGSDHLDGTALDWMNFSGDEVLAVEWKGDEDLGWHLDPDQRRAQTDNGYWHGPLRALVDHWDGDAEPSYSVAALSVINAMMSEGFGSLTFAEAARRFAGPDGADLIARTRARVAGTDDLAEPDPAPTPETSPDDPGPSATDDAHGTDEDAGDAGEPEPGREPGEPEPPSGGFRDADTSDEE